MIKQQDQHDQFIVFFWRVTIHRLQPQEDPKCILLVSPSSGHQIKWFWLR